MKTLFYRLAIAALLTISTAVYAVNDGGTGSPDEGDLICVSCTILNWLDRVLLD